ncbi:MAG: HAMP domain-containing sensor histidine kinase [Bordetella sp.]
MSNVPWFLSSWPIAGFVFAMALSLAISITTFVRRSRLLKRLRGENQELAKQVKELLASIDEQTRRRLAQGQLLLSFGHDFKQPLQAIAAHRAVLAELIASRKLPASNEQGIHDRLSGIHACLQIANELVESALDTERLADTCISPRHEPIAIESFCRDFVEQLRPLATSFHSEVELHCWQPENVCVSSDLRLLGRILRNLLINALRHADGRRIRITIRLRERLCRIAVLDNGIGMTSETRGRLQRAFRSSIPLYVLPNEKGSGLGLLISRQLASSIGARLGVSSHLAHGSGFFLDLPVCQFGQEEPAQVLTDQGLSFANPQVTEARVIVWVQNDDVALDAQTDATFEAFRLSLKAEGYRILDSKDGSLRIAQLEGLKAPPVFSVYVNFGDKATELAISRLRDEFNGDIPLMGLTLGDELSQVWAQDKSVLEMSSPHSLKKLKSAAMRLQSMPHQPEANPSC